MNEVHKFVLPQKRMVVMMPAAARVLHVASQAGWPAVWVRLSPDDESVRRYFYTVETGEAFPDELEYVGTFHPSNGLGSTPPYVGHVFEGPR